VQRIAKKVLIGVGVLFGVLALALLLVNIYLQSSSVQERIRAGVGKQMGGEVTVRSTMYLPWTGLVLRGISVPDARQANAKMFDAEAVRVRFALLPLLKKQFVVTELTVFGPTLLANQSANGAWVFPAASPKEAKPEAIPEGVVEAVTDKPKSTFSVEVQRVRIRNANTTFYDAKGKPLLTLSNINIDARTTPKKALRGRFDVGTLDLANLLIPTDITGEFVWNGKTLLVSNIDGKLAGGKLLGKYRLDVRPETKFSLEAAVDGAKLKKLAEDIGAPTSGTAGVANAQLILSGDPKKTASFVGNGSLDLINAKLTPLAIIQQIGTILGVDELQMLRLKNANATFQIRDDKVEIEKAVMQSENIIISGQGPIRLDGKMKINAQLLVNQKIQKQLRGMLSDNFVESADPNYKQLEFRITGTVQKPKTDLIDKLTGMNIGSDMGGLLNRFFRRPSSQPTPEKKTP
jgi:uncharacterized protein involved in outer membrane biogenesis